jgi:hypothetical protein
MVVPRAVDGRANKDLKFRHQRRPRLAAAVDAGGWDSGVAGSETVVMSTEEKPGFTEETRFLNDEFH